MAQKKVTMINFEKKINFQKKKIGQYHVQIPKKNSNSKFKLKQNFL